MKDHTMEITSGIDISKHQGNLDIDKDGDLGEIYDAGHRFVIMKATEGGDYTDPRFESNWAAMAKTPLLYPGAYHFARPDLRVGRAGGEKEGQNFVQALKRAGVPDKMLPPALDWEKYSDANWKENRPWIEGWLDVVEQELGRKCTIYTGINVWQYETGIPKGNDWTDLAWLAKRCYLWLVQYNSRGANPERAPSKPILGWPHTLWQWSGGGQYAFGPKVLDKVVDINRFDGSLKDLEVLCSAGKVDPSPNYFALVSKAFADTTRAQALLSLCFSAADDSAVSSAREALVEAIASLDAASNKLS